MAFSECFIPPLVLDSLRLVDVALRPTRLHLNLPLHLALENREAHG